MGGRSFRAWWVAVAVAGAAAFACSNGDRCLGGFGGDTCGGDGSVPEASVDADVDACLFGCDGGSPDAAPAAFDVTPSSIQVVTVQANQTSPTLDYAATKNGQPISVTWTVDRGEAATVGPVTGTSTTFAPTGTVGGLVHVIATWNGNTVQRDVLIKLTASQNGYTGGETSQVPASTNDLLKGGGVGGVGGEGLGGAVDTTTAGVLASPGNDGKAQGLAIIYPYAGTMWPRGILAPLIQWSWSFGDADAIQINLTTSSGSFTYSGTFSRPAILQQSGGKFIRHPIPQDIWQMATDTAGGVINGQRDHLTLSVTLAKNGQGYGPITQTWDVAPGRLKGTVYYGSYGTRLSTSNWSNQIGASVLAIKHGATDPTLVTSSTECQVCHGVAAKGSDLVAEDDKYPGDGNDWDVWYDLTNPTQPQWPGTWLPKTTPGLYTWGAISPDGLVYFSNSAPCNIASGSKCMSPDPNNALEGATDTPSGLYALSSGSGIVSPSQIQTQLGLTSQLGGSLPEFSPDGKHVVFTFYKGGPGSDGSHGDGKSLAVVDFDESTKTFSNLRTLYTPTCSGCVATAPFFLPTSDGVVFELVTRSNGWFAGTTADKSVDQSWSNCPNLNGARAELWWVDLATKQAHRLDIADGNGYLPTGPDGHDDDTSLQFDPTVAPIVSGGYMWVAFTSRRLYGSVATINPWCSQTNGVDFTPYSQNPMTKKLWVAAFDVGATPGTDPSHAAFYLPGQELTAGNFRSFWVLDPCESDGSSCETGDECCGGYCETPADGGALVCGSTKQGCGNEGDTCTTNADCCGLVCIAGHCDVPTPPN